MTMSESTHSQLEVLVLRAEKPRVGFLWQLREYGKGIPFLIGDTLHSSQADAREAGKEALVKLSATHPLQLPAA